MPVCRFVSLPIVLFGLVLPGQAIAQRIPPAGFQVDIFTSDQGLPGHQIYDIEQTADGFLWVTTSNGMARFDGYDFETFPEALDLQPDGHLFTDLYILPSDTLILSTSLGYVASYSEGSFGPYSLSSEAGIDELARDRTGRWWGVRHLDMLQEAGGRLTVLHENAAGAARPNMYVDSEGDPWVVVRESILSGPETEEITTAAGPDRFVLARMEGGQPEARGTTLFEHVVTNPSAGEVLFSRRRGNTVEFFNKSGVARGAFLLPTGSRPLLIDHQGHLWVDEGGFLSSFAPGASSPGFEIEVPVGGISVWLEDREGNLWIGTTLDGLMRVRRTPFDVYMPDGETEALSITQGKNGSVLAIFAFTGGVYRILEGNATHLMNNVKGLYEDPGDYLLYQGVSPGPYPGILVQTSGGIEVLLGKTVGGVAYSQIYPDPQEENVYWTHDAKTLYRVDEPFGRSPRLTIVLDSLTEARHLLRDRSGNFWVASRGGLFRIDASGATRHFTVDDGLPDNALRSVFEDEEGTLWIGTRGSGLVRYRDDRFSTVTTSDGLAEDIVSSILEDDDGYLWMAGDRGVQRAHRDSLNAFLDRRTDGISSVLFGRESGMINPEASGFAGLRGADGRMWFPTYAGAVVVDPSTALFLERHAPLMHVTGVRVGDDVLPTGEPVRLEAAQRRLEITYVGLSLRHPERTTYRYRLSGFDDEWVDAGLSRSAVYTNLSAGTHTFEVQARSFGGIWSEIDDTLTLHVDRFFYETWWFAVLVGLGLLGSATIIYRRRIQAMEQRQTELHALVDERTKELVREKETVAAQAEQLRSLDKAKSRLFANVSHEFRTPLTLILGPLEDLQDGREGPLGKGVRRNVDSAVRNGRRLLGLVNQLLDIARLESGRLQLKARKIEFGEYVEQIIQAFVPLSERRRVTIRFERPVAPINVCIDPGQFEKVLSNLLGNALKFTPEESTVLVSLESVPGGSDGEDEVLLRVRDNGPGISAEHLPHVFDRFYQVDESSSLRQTGTGIGLALVRSLVELHHGSADVESEVGFGTTFTIRFPAGSSHFGPHEIVDLGPGEYSPVIVPVEIPDDRRQPDDSASDMDADLANEDSATVLVVDDNSDVRSYVRRHLAARYRVLESADGKEALAQVRQSMPDLIVSDVMMPNMNGFELCHAIRNDPELAFIPILLLTARASTDSRMVGLEEGADDYLTKPFNVRELEIRIENLLAVRQRLKASLHTSPTTNGARANSVRPSSSGKESFVTRVREVIAARLSEEDFGVDALASALGLGRTTLYSRLADLLDASPMDLIWRMRLERAASMLRDREGNVSEVAYGVGFKSVGHFCRRFRLEFDCTPTEYIARSENEAG